MGGNPIVTAAARGRPRPVLHQSTEAVRSLIWEASFLMRDWAARDVALSSLGGGSAVKRRGRQVCAYAAGKQQPVTDG